MEAPDSGEYGEARAGVRRCNHRRIQEAREILSGSVLNIHCVVPLCPAEESMLQFHHIAGDGNKETDRTQSTIARWIIKHPAKARKKIELRCRNHHLVVDQAIGVRKCYLTAEQVQEVRLAPRECGKRIGLSALHRLAKKFNVKYNTLVKTRYRGKGGTWKRLPWPEILVS